MSWSIPDPSAESRASRQIMWYTRLWAAVVRRAAVDWVLYRNHETSKLRKVGQDAEYWIFLDKEENRLSSFVSVCDILGLEPSLMREKVRNLSEEDARRLRGMEFGDDW